MFLLLNVLGLVLSALYSLKFWIINCIYTCSVKMVNSIPLWILRDLKCRHCKNFLSCGPVYVTPDCGLLCGRCRALAKPNFRNYVYEELASVFRFPCQNWEKRCPVDGAWDFLREHEIDCSYSGSCGLICVDPAAFFSSRRSLPNEESLLYIEVPDKSLNLVSCKNCGKYLSCEPVHINVVGSNVCHRCYLSNGVPPHTLRNLAYEKLANIFRFPCIFRSKGCPIKMKFGRDSWEHEIACHYRDIKLMTTSPSPPIELELSENLSYVDNSGYRLSTDEGRSPVCKEPPNLELPRVSFILKDPPFKRRVNDNLELKINGREDLLKVSEVRRVEKETPQSASPKNITNEISIKFQENSSINEPAHGKEKIMDKERGIVPTHTGHVYAMLTHNSILFAPPQIQPNKDPTSGINVTKEFRDKVRRNASNASQNGTRTRHQKQQTANNWPQQDGNYSSAESLEDVTITRNETCQIVDPLGFPALNKHQMRNFEEMGGDFAPVVTEYVQYNPQNNIQRNDSMTIGNADLIAELKMRNEQRRRNRQHDENFNDIAVH